MHINEDNEGIPDAAKALLQSKIEGALEGWLRECERQIILRPDPPKEDRPQSHSARRRKPIKPRRR